MKILQNPAKLTTIFMVFISLYFCAGYSISQTSAPSKAETVEYIKNKVMENPSDFNFWTNFSSDGCVLKLTGKGYDYYSTIDLNKTHIVFTDYRTGQYAIEIKCSAGECIKVDKQKPASANGFVYTSDMQFANRIYKSLNHLKSLCVARNELF